MDVPIRSKVLFFNGGRSVFLVEFSRNLLFCVLFQSCLSLWFIKIDTLPQLCFFRLTLGIYHLGFSFALVAAVCLNFIGSKNTFWDETMKWGAKLKIVYTKVDASHGIISTLSRFPFQMRDLIILANVISFHVNFLTVFDVSFVRFLLYLCST